MPGKSARSEQTQTLPECSAHRFGVSARFAEGATTLSRESKSAPPSYALSIQASKLDALTTMLYGPCLGDFQGMDPSIQESLLWLISDLASEVHALAQLNEQYVDAVNQLVGEQHHA